MIFVIDAASADISSSSSSSSATHTQVAPAAKPSSGGGGDGTGRSSDVDRKQGSANSLSDAASYLHDLLLILQRKENVPVLIAANKADLFTAVPVSAAKAALEREITAIRRARVGGLLDSAVGADDVAVNEEWLGDEEGNENGRNRDFKFEELRGVDVNVEVRAGNVVGEDGPGMDGWWDWIAAQM